MEELIKKLSNNYVKFSELSKERICIVDEISSTILNDMSLLQPMADIVKTIIHKGVHGIIVCSYSSLAGQYDFDLFGIDQYTRIKDEKLIIATIDKIIMSWCDKRGGYYVLCNEAVGFVPIYR